MLFYLIIEILSNLRMSFSIIIKDIYTSCRDEEMLMSEGAICNFTFILLNIVRPT